jgi:hypothetical protein
MHSRDYERAGREAAEVLEEGGLKKWEGKVRIASSHGIGGGESLHNDDRSWKWD